MYAKKLNPTPISISSEPDRQMRVTLKMLKHQVESYHAVDQDLNSLKESLGLKVILSYLDSQCMNCLKSHVVTKTCVTPIDFSILNQCSAGMLSCLC